MVEWLYSGLQIRLSRFDSGCDLQYFETGFNMPKVGAFQNSYWFEVWELDNLGNRIIKNEELTDWFSHHNDIDFSVEKSITSNADTANITVYNHRILEQMYSEKYMFFKKFHEKDYEVDLMYWKECGDANVDDLGSHVHCIFSGDLDNIYPSSNGSIKDQSVSFDLTAGRRASTRTITNKKYPAGTPYRVIVQDLFSHFVGYNLSVLDDPLGKLNKTTLKSRTFDGKTSTLLNSIATDLEMTWSFDSTPWLLSDRRIGGTGNTTLPPKNCYWVDKTSVFDVAGVNGIGPHNVNGSTGKRGRIGYSKDQITFETSTDPILNIGLLVNVSDYGTMNDAVDFQGRINRMSINNDSTSIEASYYDNGKVILEFDKKNAGAFIL